MSSVDMAAILVAHYAQPHGCCWIVAPEYVQCGRLCGHDGPHLPYVPGDYLRPVELHPLDVLRLQRSDWLWLACPVCGHLVRPWDWDAEGPGLFGWDVGGECRNEVATVWRFRPCGCEARKVIP